MFCLSPFISWNWAILSFSRNIYTILQTSVRWTIIFILKTISKNEQECKIDGVKKILFSCGYRKKRENEAISPYHIYGWAHAPHQSLYHMHEHTPLDDLIIGFPFHLLWDLTVLRSLRWGIIWDDWGWLDAHFDFGAPLESLGDQVEMWESYSFLHPSCFRQHMGHLF